MILFEETRPATAKDVSRLRAGLQRSLRDLRINDAMLWDVILAAAEVATNVVRHSAPSATQITLRLSLIGAQLRLEVMDDGGPFAAFSKARGAGSRLADPLAESGRGLQLVDDALERITYTSGACNSFVGWKPLVSERPLVLIVEDDDTLMELYRNFLRRDYRLVSACTLEEGARIARELDPAVIVTDLHLGEGLGTALMPIFDIEAARLSPPMVVMTSDQDPKARQVALERGVEFFLSKPVTGDRLRDAVSLSLTRSVGRNVRLARYFIEKVDSLVAAKAPATIFDQALVHCRASAGAGGGDLVLHHETPGRQRLVMIDVMGHGVAAKAWSIAFAATARALLHVTVPAGPEAFLTLLAEVVWQDTAFDHVIATAIVLDVLPDGSMEVACAGHPPPAVVSSSAVRRLEVAGSVLGVLEPGGYQALSFRLDAGERLLLVTDGVDAAEVATGGDLPEWLIEAARADDFAPSNGRLLREQARDVLGAQPKDDWTVLALVAPDRPARS